MIDYTKLFHLLENKKMKRTDLLKVISSPTLARIGKNEIVKTDTIDKICLLLDVQPSDIMEVYEPEIIDGKVMNVKTRIPMSNYPHENDIKTLIVKELENYLKTSERGNKIIDEDKLQEELDKLNK